MSSFRREAHVHREGHRNYPAAEDRHGVAGGHIRYQQDFIDYRVEATFQTLGHQSTKVEISHYYSTTTLKAKLLNLIAKGKIAGETQATLNGAKATIEGAYRAGYGSIKPVAGSESC
jgi:hypothetical protein